MPLSAFVGPIPSRAGPRVVAPAGGEAKVEIRGCGYAFHLSTNALGGGTRTTLVVGVYHGAKELLYQCSGYESGWIHKVHWTHQSIVYNSRRHDIQWPANRFRSVDPHLSSCTDQ
jgi:hypothetical protein